MASAVGNFAIFAPFCGKREYGGAFSLRSIQGACEAVISAAILPERATWKNGQIATALRVALNRVSEKAPLILFPYQIRGKIGRGLRWIRSYSPLGGCACEPALPTADFECNRCHAI